jgi:uncharacterized membrane protein YbjE (DUF340 family)
MAADLSPRSPDAARLRRANRRTALTVASIAVLFFAGVIAAQFIGDAATGMSVVGGAALLFLAFAIGRNLGNRGGPDA